jgi:hypothetical protein
MFALQWKEGKTVKGTRLHFGVTGKWTIFTIEENSANTSENSRQILRCFLPGFMLTNFFPSFDAAAESAELILLRWVEGAQK